MRRMGPLGGTLMSIMLIVGAACGADERSSQPVDVNAALFPKGEAFDANIRLVEEAIQLCMQEAGFSYEQRSHEIAEQDSLDFPTLGTWTEDLADQYGFGMAKLPAQRRLGGFEDLAGESEAAIAAQAEQYNVCRAHASESVNGLYREQITPLIASFEDLKTEFQADPAVVAIQADWASCMRSAGYESTESFPEFVMGFLRLQDEFVLTNRTLDLTVEAQAELDQRIADERAAALDAVTCADPIRADYNDIWDEYQRRFAADFDIPELPT